MARSHIIVLIAAALVCAACEQTHYPEGAAPAMRTTADVGLGHAQTLNTVVILDGSLQHWVEVDKYYRGKIAVESTSSRRTDTDTLEAWAIFRNRTDYPLQIETRVSFFDASQAPLGDPSAWQRLYLPPNGTENYRERSLDIDVAYYRIEVREGR